MSQRITQSKWKGYSAAVVASLVGFLLAWNWVNLAGWAAKGIWPDLWTMAGQIWRVTFFGYFAFVAYKHLFPGEDLDDRWNGLGRI